MSAPSLSAAIVTYRTPEAMLARALESLARAVHAARTSGALGGVDIFLIDNTERTAAIPGAALRAWPHDAGTMHVIAGHGNVGYGRANNLVLDRLRSDVHLVMNPDVELHDDALTEGLEALRAHPDVGLVAPDVAGDDGERQYLCKRYPSALVLCLRGFAPRPVRSLFAARLDRYEMRDVMRDRFREDVQLASGCFMLLRTALFRSLNGFDPRFFMYFEDYDLSMRLAREAKIGYAPRMRIVHHGGDASRKGWRHVAWFAGSARRFFALHGWKLV